MIPLKLTLKNFLSYGPSEQTIPFESYSLMCLSGKNGHGKSSILDGLTWAIWGCARKMVGVAKGDEGLVHLGQKEMVVHLEFLVNSQKYRIRREYFKSYGKPITRLDVEVFDAVLNQFVTLTDKSVRATQDKIERIVGLDFDTFVSTSFLRQGQSNEFSKKTPRERKEVIAAILGLGSYDQKAVIALEKSKEFSQKITQIKLLAEQSKNIMAQAPQVDERMALVQVEIHRVADELAIATKKNNECAHKLQQIELVQREISRIDQTKTLLQDQERQVLSSIREKIISWRGLHARLIRIPSLDSLMLERSSAAEELLRQQAKEKQVFALQQKIHTATTSLESIEVALRHEHELRKNDLLRKKDEIVVQLKYLETSLADLVVRKESLAKQLVEFHQKQTQLIAQLANREQIEMAYDQAKRLFEKRRSFYHACVSKRKVAEVALAEIADHKSIVSNVENPSCPLCQQLVTIKRKNFLVGQLTKQEQFQHHKFSRVTTVLHHLESLLTLQRAELEREARVCLGFQSAEQDLVRITNIFQETEREYQRFCQVEQDLGEQKNNLTKSFNELERAIVESATYFEAILATHEKILQLKQLLAVLRNEDALLAYNPEELVRISAQVAKFDAQLKDLQQRDALSHDATRIKHSFIADVIDVRRIRKELGLLILQSEQLGQVVLGHAAITEEKRTLDNAVNGMLAKRDEYSRELGSLSERKKRCDEAVESLKLVDAQVDALLYEKKEYDLLVEAYGKNGVQALLIESVLPEIEQEANLLLARLTDNQMQIFIESLRDLKGGGVRETLDIQISDSVGIRPYEMFSGGEAFRIDFALRIAVSRLLARRAGTHLQTLLIDEGFGSQDEEGLSRLTHALFAVQKDFEKIIVVSHLERLKENFPVHVVVEKRAGASIVHVEERG